MEVKYKNNANIRRFVSLCTFIMIMVLYISIQLYWGSNLYKAFVNEEKKEYNSLLSNVITSDASTILSKSASNPDAPIFTMERVSPDNDSVLSNAIVTEVLREPEELTNMLEKTLIAMSIKTDSLFIDRLAQSFKQKLLSSNVYSFDLYLSINDSLSTKTTSKVTDKTSAFYPISIEVQEEFEVEGEKYFIGSTLTTELPTSLKVLTSLFVLGILLLVFILYLLIKMTQKIELEKAMNHQQELFFYGLVHDLKLPLSLAHSLIDGLIYNVDMPNKSHSGLIEADNHILKLTDDINMLLTMHRLKQNKKSEYRQIYLYDVVQDIIIEIEAHYPEKEISFLIEFPNDLSIFFPAEELKLIMRVFLDNAVKYSQHAPIVTIQATNDGSTVSIKIGDNGSGIKSIKEYKSYELNQARIRQICNESNGGIGLMVAWTIINSKGGKITYNKIDSTGSLFTLSIPIEENKYEENNAH